MNKKISTLLLQTLEHLMVFCMFEVRVKRQSQMILKIIGVRVKTIVIKGSELFF